MDASKPVGVNAFALKVLAIVAMTMDHTAYIFYEALGGWAIWMRVIGPLDFSHYGLSADRGVGKNSQYRPLCSPAGSVCDTEYASLLFCLWGLEECSLYPPGRTPAPVGAERDPSRVPWLPEWLLQIGFGGLAICLAILMGGFDWGFPGILAIYCIGQVQGETVLAPGADWLRRPYRRADRFPGDGGDGILPALYQRLVGRLDLAELV